MKDEREREIQYQFLDEAQEYLQTLETSLIGIADCRVDIEGINVALRAAHSIKGGAGMMGFQLLNQLAHRLEDTLKVLKIQREVEIDGELEGLLLTAVSNLGDVLESDRQGLLGDRSLDLQALEAQVMPVFDRLHERLGDPNEEDARSMLAVEEGQDIIPILFETEVESCLQQLEAVLDKQDEQLGSEQTHPEEWRSQLETLAEELMGLGEMLQLQKFTELCESILQQVATSPAEHLEAVAESALQAWRRSQALVLSGHLDLLPTALAFTVSDPTVSDPTASKPIGISFDRSMPPEQQISVEQIEEFPATAVDLMDEDAVISIPVARISSPDPAIVALIDPTPSPAIPSALEQFIFSPTPLSQSSKPEQDTASQRLEIRPISSGSSQEAGRESAKESAKESQES